MRLIIEPGHASATYWRDLWHYRELLAFLSWRDIVVRYKQTVIGLAWALLRPALTMVVFIAFRRLANFSASASPDAIVVFAAVLPWQFFSTAVNDASNSLIVNANLVSKVYFPRMLIPLAAIITAFGDFVVTLGLMVALMAIYQVAPSRAIAFLPVFTLLAMALAAGIGLGMSAINVSYRDFRYIVPFAIQLGLFVSPIAFTTADVPSSWRTLYSLNPLVGIIDGFRWSVLGTGEPPTTTVAWSVAVSAAALIIGAAHFRHVERRLADTI